MLNATFPLEIIGQCKFNTTALSYGRIVLKWGEHLRNLNLADLFSKSLDVKRAQEVSKKLRDVACHRRTKN
uniref:Uncharacterized protein n=1 Tax=Megaselia scalaris TaxID=36166 RepID=T1H281_MEGSC